MECGNEEIPGVACDREAGHGGSVEHSALASSGDRIWWPTLCRHLKETDHKISCSERLDHEGWHKGTDADGKTHYWPYI